LELVDVARPPDAMEAIIIANVFIVLSSWGRLSHGPVRILEWPA
jgi:hypothetical protein